LSRINAGMSTGCAGRTRNENRFAVFGIIRVARYAVMSTLLPALPAELAADVPLEFWAPTSLID
jgi:hypothetical protein